MAPYDQYNILSTALFNNALHTGRTAPNYANTCRCLDENLAMLHKKVLQKASGSH